MLYLMNIKECYVSQNGITCFTNINTLVSIKDIELNPKINTLNSIINKNTFLFYIGLRCCEFIIKDFIKNRNYLFEEDYILSSIMFS
jgi:hypothetical protein